MMKTEQPAAMLGLGADPCWSFLDRTRLQLSSSKHVATVGRTTRSHMLYHFAVLVLLPCMKNLDLQQTSYVLTAGEIKATTNARRLNTSCRPLPTVQPRHDHIPTSGRCSMSRDRFRSWGARGPTRALGFAFRGTLAPGLPRTSQRAMARSVQKSWRAVRNSMDLFHVCTSGTSASGRRNPRIDVKA